jgi:hypothetical protein
MHWLLVAIVAVCGSGAVSSQQSDTDKIGWLGLFNDELVSWLENENQLNSLCPFDPNSADGYRCRDEKLAVKVHAVTLRARPAVSAAYVGSLLIVSTPGKGLRSFFLTPRGGAPVEFVPDVFDNDWGYGPNFHQTFVERQGTWFRLATVPFPRSTWINASDLGGEPRLHLLEEGEIVAGPFGDLFILGTDRDVLRARDEQAADRCGGEDIRLKPYEEIRIPFSKLYTATGHLLLLPKYLRGC